MQTCLECGEVFDLKPNEKKSTTTLCPDHKPERYELISDDGVMMIFQVVRKLRCV